MNRRRFIIGVAAGAGTAAAGWPGLPSARAATDDELAFANFAVAAELLLGDSYANASAISGLGRETVAVLRAGRRTARRHAQALGELLVGAGQTAPVRDDFDFAWPRRTFADLATATATGLKVTHTLLGTYQTALASVSVPSYRVLYASLAGSLGQQAGALGGGVAVEPFPVAIDLESASAALEGYLG